MNQKSGPMEWNASQHCIRRARQRRGLHLVRLLPLLALILGTAAGQYVETTIYLPDSIIGLKDPRCCVLADSGRRVLLAGAPNWVIGIDCATGAKIGRVAVSSPVVALGAGAGGSKVYCAHAQEYPGRDSAVTVLDPATMTVRTRIHPGVNPTAFAWSERHRRLYCACKGDSAIAFICGQGDTLLDRHPVRANPIGLAYSEELDRLYVRYWYDRWLTVLDGSTGELLDSVDIGQYPSALLLNPRTQRLYVPYAAGLIVLACSTNTKLADLYVGRFPVDLAFDPVSDRLFYALNNSDAVGVIDCARNQVLGQIGVGDSPRHLVWDSVHSRILCANYLGSSVSVIDPQSMTVTATIATRPQPAPMLCDGTTGKTFVLHEQNASTSVIDAATGTLISSLMLWEDPRFICWNPGNSRLFCVTNQSRLYAIDGTTNEVIFGVDIAPAPTGLVADAVAGKVYVSSYNDSTVTSYDANTGQVVKRIKVGANPSCLAANPVDRKIYCCRSMRLQIIDPRTDSVRAGLSAITRGTALLYNPASNKVLAIDAVTRAVVIISGATDAILGTIRVGGDPTTLGVNLAPRNEMYCTYPASHWALAISDSLNAIADTMIVPGYPGPVTGSGSDGRIYLSDLGQHKIYVFARENHELVDSISGVGEPACITLNESDWHVYSSDRSGDRVLVIDPVWDTVIAVLPVAAGPSAIATNPAQRRIYVMNERASAITVLQGVTGLAEAAPGPARPGLVITPNPAHDQVELQFHVTHPGRLTLTVYDVAGRQVRSEPFTVARRGAMNHSFGVSELAPGVYVVCLQQARTVQRGRLLVTRP